MNRIMNALRMLIGALKTYYKRAVLVVVLLVAFVVLNLVSYAMYDVYKNPQTSAYTGYQSESDYSENKDCNVTGINLHGQLITYMPAKEPLEMVDVVPSDYVSYYIKKAEKDERIKAIVLEVDSSGGSPVAGEEIAHALKHSTKPTVALIRQAGLSAAYWAATGADTIFASKNSDIGSIGVTFSYLDNVDKNKKDGLRYVPLYSGQYKEMGSPDRTLTEAERNLIMRDLKIIHANFINDVAQNRNIPVERISALADGSSMLGENAKTFGLIDRIGNLIDVEQYLTDTLGEEVEICWE